MSHVPPQIKNAFDFYGPPGEYPGRDHDTWHKEPIGAWSVYHIGHDANKRWCFWDGRCRAHGLYLTKEEALEARFQARRGRFPLVPQPPTLDAARQTEETPDA